MEYIPRKQKKTTLESLKVLSAQLYDSFTKLPLSVKLSVAAGATILACAGATALYTLATAPIRIQINPPAQIETTLIQTPVEAFTPTYTPQPTGTPTSTPRPTNTPRPTATPTPVPLGLNGIVQGQNFYIQLVDYEFRPLNHPENAAIKYIIRFVNESSVTADVEFSTEDISAVDNNGTGYSDYVVLARDYWSGRCISLLGSPNFSQYIDQRFEIPPGGFTDIEFYLNRNDTKGDCGEYGVGISRVDIETDYVDIKLGRITYRTEQLYEIFGARWRLTR